MCAVLWVESGGAGVRREERFHETAPVKRHQIFGAFSDTDILDGNPEIRKEGKNRASLGAAVQFRQDDTGNPDLFVKFPGLRDIVLAYPGVQHEERLMGGRGHPVLQHPFYLLEFLDKIVLGVEPPRSINKQVVNTPRLGPNQRIKGNGGGVRPLFLGNHLDAEAVAPYRELLNGRVTKRIPGRK